MCERKTVAKDLCAKRFFNLLGVLARFWKIRRNSQKIKKMQNQFFGFCVSSPTTFVKHDHTFEF
jgi:hypothetical protein